MGMKKAIPKPSITEVVEHYGATVLGSSGGWQKATCPLRSHEDMSPSASLNEDECKWRCFGCNKGGDAIDLIMENENAGWADAVKIAESFSGGGDGAVREERERSGLLSRSSGSRRGGGSFVPPWKSL